MTFDQPIWCFHLLSHLEFQPFESDCLNPSQLLTPLTMVPQFRLPGLFEPPKSFLLHLM